MQQNTLNIRGKTLFQDQLWSLDTWAQRSQSSEDPRDQNIESVRAWDNDDKKERDSYCVHCIHREYNLLGTVMSAETSSSGELSYNSNHTCPTTFQAWVQVLQTLQHLHDWNRVRTWHIVHPFFFFLTYVGPASMSSTLNWGISDSRFATTGPAVPPVSDGLG